MPPSKAGRPADTGVEQSHPATAVRIADGILADRPKSDGQPHPIKQMTILMSAKHSPPAALKRDDIHEPTGTYRYRGPLWNTFYSLMSGSDKSIYCLQYSAS